MALVSQIFHTKTKLFEATVGVAYKIEVKIYMNE